MSAHSEKPPREEIKNHSTDEVCIFKKTNTVHDCPPVTDHDFHKDLMDDPPRNIPDGAVPGFADDGMKAPRKDEKEVREPPLGLYEEEGIGRAKPLDIQTDLIDTSESTSRA